MRNMEKSSRPVRNRRNNRKNWLHHDTSSNRPIKRLFTPEIKRMLKDWLVRRRENPYPSRDEKKALAVETGLTYTQICNWFANWRRKLKNTSEQKKSWGILIKNYNNSAKGNVEQFSICSEDSIWGEPEGDRDSFKSSSSSPTQQNYNYEEMPRCNNLSFVNQLNFKLDRQQRPHFPIVQNLSQCFQISSTTTEDVFNNNNTSNNNNNNATSENTCKFYKSHKNHIMEKYLRSFGDANNNNNDETLENNNNKINHDFNSNSDNSVKPELSKWLESANNFTPSKNSYIDYPIENPSKSSKTKARSSSNYKKLHLEENFHEKEMIAVQLLANNFRTKFYNS